jgi:hypothetical protein
MQNHIDCEQSVHRVQKEADVAATAPHPLVSYPAVPLQASGLH